jgi:molybdenum-dependent DNA-binding transcriptional regulator ModE
MNDLTQYEQLALTKLDESIFNGKWSNEGLIKLVQLIEPYLNTKTISQYAKEYKMSYNGVKKCRKQELLFGEKYIIDND